MYKNETLRSAMRIISLGRFWAVNHVAGFCHVVAQMIMNEMILCNTLLLIASVEVEVSEHSLSIETFQTP